MHRESWTHRREELEEGGGWGGRPSIKEGFLEEEAVKLNFER